MSCLYQKTNGYWYISYFDTNGKRRNKATKTKLKREAKLIQRQLDNEFLDGNLQGFRKVKTKDWFKKIEDELHADPSLSDNWIRRKQFILNHLYRYFSSRAKYFHHIDLSMIESYRLDRLKSISVITVNQEISVLKQMIKKAIAQEKYPNKPILLQIEMKDYKAPEVAPLELNEIIKIIEYMKTRFHPVQWWRTQFLAFSGCRLSELNLLRWTDVE